MLLLLNFLSDHQHTLFVMKRVRQCPVFVICLNIYPKQTSTAIKDPVQEAKVQPEILDNIRIESSIY